MTSKYQKHKPTIYEDANGQCWYCGRSMPYKKACLDHVHPKARDGSCDIENLVLCCRSCNSSKGIKTLEEYRQWVEWQAIGVEPFTHAQIAWLQSNGINLPTPPRTKFHGEM